MNPTAALPPLIRVRPFLVLRISFFLCIPYFTANLVQQISLA